MLTSFAVGAQAPRLSGVLDGDVFDSKPVRKCDDQCSDEFSSPPFVFFQDVTGNLQVLINLSITLRAYVVFREGGGALVALAAHREGREGKQPGASLQILQPHTVDKLAKLHHSSVETRAALVQRGKNRRAKERMKEKERKKERPDL